MNEVEKLVDSVTDETKEIAVGELLETTAAPGLLQQRLYKLLSVKSIMSIMMTAVFCYLAAVGRVSEEQFCTIFMGVVAFYFGTKNGKSEVAQNG